jgi:integrase
LAFAHARKFFNWCVENAYLEVSPCSGMKGPPAFKARDRWLNDDELRLVWRASSDLAAPFGAFIKMLILTGQRRDEVARMAWSEIDLERAEWTIPAERCKNGKAHVVDLSPPAIELIRAQGRTGELLFTTTGSTPISGFAKVKRRLDEIVEAKRAEGAKALGLPAPSDPIPAWRVHDLRRTAATGMARLGNPPWVVEAVLNHISGVRGGLVAVYQHYEHRPERRAALRGWAEHVLAVVT